MAELLLNFGLSVILGIVLRVFVDKRAGAVTAALPLIAGALIVRIASPVYIALYIAAAAIASLVVYFPPAGFFSIGRRNYNPDEMSIPEDFVNPTFDPRQPRGDTFGKPLVLVADPENYIVVHYGTPPEIIARILENYEAGLYRHEDFAEYVIDPRG